MADKSKTAEDAAIENLAKARKANDQSNKSRVERLNSIADKNDSDPDNGMVDTDGDLVLQDPNDNKLKGPAEVAAEEAAAAEVEARRLQEEGVSADPVENKETKQADERSETKEEPKEDPNIKDVDGKTHYKTVVNGKEKWLTLDQLIATSQKVEAADEYLADAKAKVEPKIQPEVQPKEPETREDSTDWKKLLHAAVMGDEEAINKVASALEQRPSEKSEMTPDVLRQIDDRWSFRNAATWFEENYQDVLGDPLLKKLVYARDEELAAASPTMPYKQRLQAAGDSIRKAVDGWQKQPEKIEVKPSSAKAEAKRQLPAVPSAASRQTISKEEDDDESPEDIIAKMAKARGQARAIVHRSSKGG